jgi:hypothetical protein
VWHASAAKVGGGGSERELKALAYAALAGVGDRGAGEWVEWSGKAFHVRRRLTPAEQQRVGPVVDLRGTPEGIARLAALAGRLHPSLRRFAEREVARRG